MVIDVSRHMLMAPIAPPMSLKQSMRCLKLFTPASQDKRMGQRHLHLLQQQWNSNIVDKVFILKEVYI